MNSSNGLELDNTREIANEFKRDRDGMGQYPKEKLYSINSSHSKYSKSAAASNTGVE